MELERERTDFQRRVAERSRAQSWTGIPAPCSGANLLPAKLTGPQGC